MAARSSAAHALEGPPTPEQIRDRERSKRPSHAPSRTINMTRLPKGAVLAARAEHEASFDGDDPPIERPRRRSECVDGPRPCPFVSCAHHLYLDVNPRNGHIKLNFPSVAPDELELLADTCALDVADRGEATLNEIGRRVNVTRERARQILTHASAKIRATIEARTLRDLPPEAGDELAAPQSAVRVRLNVLQVDDFDVEAFASEALDD